MSETEAEKKEHLKELKKHEVHTGIPFVDKPLNTMDNNHDGLPDVPQLMEQIDKYKPYLEAALPLIDQVKPLLNKEKLEAAKQKLIEFVLKELTDADNQEAVRKVLLKGLKIATDAAEAVK